MEIQYSVRRKVVSVFSCSYHSTNTGVVQSLVIITSIQMTINLALKMMIMIITLVVGLLVHITCAKIITCPSCGTIRVPYPLSTTPTCGQPAYKVRCVNRALKFDTLNNTYPIISISPKTQQLVIQRSHLLLNSCINGTHGVKLNASFPFTITHSNCTDPDVELMWAPPPEPGCKTQACCDSTSTCRAAHDGMLRCFCKPKLHWDALGARCASDFVSTKPRRIILVAAAMCSVVMLLSVALAVTMFVHHKNIKAEHKRIAREREEMVASGEGGKTAKIFTRKEIKRATNNFSSRGLLGVGGFGEVYKGVLDCGTTVAVKCAKLGNTKSIDQVLNEVRILCQVNHKNLVQLLGCCVEKQPLLVYEYVPNGSLFDHLHGLKKQRLTWTQRLGIARDTASGLTYLHFSTSSPIYHRDVKSSNILLDHKMKAKVADFGLSRLAQVDVTHVTTCAQGTLGYLDPDYYWNYQLTDKSDVYSFGVVLLEILTCLKAIDFGRPTDDVNLVAYAKRMVNEEKLVDVIDPIIKKDATLLEIDGMKAFGFLAMSCLEERRENRPSMKEVYEEIEYIMGVVATADE
ncbi:wall-associated receptor kinase-like 20 [Rutidosis leptorrhynchoides]|uniref:wall-associated receptor kinase-like 20 n=1 Tax=Rutidosis leptorrhynchoides TaxID=125765 RepID=UPI003A99C1C2